MAAVHIVLVRRQQQAPLAVRDGVLDLERARGERGRLAAGGGNGVEVPVAVPFPREQDAAVVRPVELVGRGGPGKDAPPAGRARNTSRPAPGAPPLSSSSTTRMLHGGPSRRGMNRYGRSSGGVRTKAIAFPSGEKAGEPSRSTAGSR